MEDCKYRLPCGRCEKLGTPCDAPKACDAPKECDHSWDAVSYKIENNDIILSFKCNKCGMIKVQSAKTYIDTVADTLSSKVSFKT